MLRRPLRLLAGALVLLALAAGFATAKQLRISVTNFNFTPQDVTINQGDHAVWIWNNTVHTVTSGLDLTPDGHFNSGDVAVANITFSWKANFVGLQPYYCIPHWPTMVGTLTLTASGATGLSDFRITEVQFNAPGNLDKIEITNFGSTGNLGMYRLKVAGTSMVTLRNGPSTDLPLASGARMVLFLNASGINSDSTLYLSGVTGLPDAAGSVALYVPNTVNTSATLADQIIDYVSWGSGGQENESTAATANLWGSGTAVTSVAAGHSIEFCGQAGQYGRARWDEIPVPTFGGSSTRCAVPIIPSTWGRIKTLYR